MNNDILHKWLFSLSSPSIALMIESDEEKKWEAKYYFGVENYLVRVLRGHKMKTVQDLMNEFSASLQFFEQFGENWYALSDCLQIDLEQWMPFDGILLVIKRAEEILSLENEQLIWLLVVIQEVGTYWKQPITDDERYKRNACPFRVLFETSEMYFAALKKRIQDAVHQHKTSKISFQIFT